MVFESLLADILNRYLGDYVQDLDRSQLKLGIWGGNVVLEDLYLKPNALDELNLPVKTVFGKIGKLVLKIPWKNLYNAPVVASVERLFLLLVPNHERNDGFLNTKKQAELHRLEMAKQLRKEKAKSNSSDTFREKLATQIIRNIQVKIQDIHIRYEDCATNPERPFSVGITLHNLLVHTTDENWRECIIKEKDKDSTIYKLLVLEGLAVYWNCNTQLFTQLGAQVSLERLLQDGIYTKDKLLEGYVYMLGPINSSVQLQLNPQPENTDYTVPKVLLTLLMEQLAIAVSKEQYHSVLELLEFFNQASHVVIYHRIRPRVMYTGHYKEWWKYAVMRILEQCGHSRFRLNWDCVARHRVLCRTYAAAYRNKLKEEKCDLEMQKALDDCENGLDVFNIWLVRQQIEAEVEWMDQQVQQETKAQGFSFFGLFRRKPQKKQDSIADKFKGEMSSEERLRLYQAIDYQEDALPTQYPSNFVAMRISFLLNSLTVEVRNNDCSDSPQVLLAELSGVTSRVEQRPGARAIKVVAKIKQFSMYGSKYDGVTPHVISSRTVEKSHLLDVMFETKPLDGACDQRLRMFALPLQIVYDARTVEQVADVFRAPNSNVLSQLQTAQLNALWGMSASGLQHAIEQHTVTDIEVDFKSSYVLIPYAGHYHRDEDVLVVNLGHLSIVKLHKGQNSTPHTEGLTGEHLTQLTQAESFDRFLVELKDVQVLVALRGEDWETALKQQLLSPLHLLQPTSLSICADKCLVKNYTTLPKLKLAGKLSAVAIHVEEQRFMHLMALSQSIVFPNTSEPTQAVGYRPSDISLVDHLLEEFGTPKNASPDGDAGIQTINIELKFVMEGLTVGMYRPVLLYPNKLQGPISLQKILDFQALRLQVDMIVRTFDVRVVARLGGVMLTYNGPEGALRLLEPSSTSTQQLRDMLTIMYITVNKNSPEFISKHGSVEQHLMADFTCLNVLLQREALVALLECASSISVRLEAARLTSPSVDVHKSSSSTWLLKANNSWRRSSSSPAKMKIKAVMHELKVFLISRHQTIAHLLVEGLEAWGFIKTHSTEFITKLRNVMLMYDNVKSPHQKILSIVGDEALSAQVILNNRRRGHVEINVDMSIKAQLARGRIVFLNSFVTSLLEFLAVFHDAQEDIALAMAEAAEAAKQGMLQVHAKAKRLQLEIDMQAPLIVIPVNSTSLDALQMDFGKLIIRNKTMTLQPDEEGRSPVVDIIHLSLQNVKLSRVTLASSGEVLSEHCILKPVSFHLQLKRNLSLKWYRSMPDLVMLGCLKAAQVALSKDDVQVLMKIFFQNLVPSTGSRETLIEPHKPAKKLDVQSLSGKKSMDRPLTWDLNLELSTLKADLGLRRQEVLVHFSVTGMFVFIFRRDAIMQVIVKVKDITVLNPDSHTIYQKVLAVEGDEALSSKVILYDHGPEHRNTEAEVTDNDVSIWAHMARIRVVFLSDLFHAMMEFLSAFQEAQGDIAVAVAEAAEAAKQGVLEAHAKAKRIVLDVDFKAPLVIVPVDPTSVNALLLDYGNLTIKNKFTEMTDAETGKVVVLDQIQLGLQNLKVSRVELGPCGEVLTERWLLQPVDFLLQVNRNLCASWYRIIPDVDVQGHLKSVMVSGDQDDVQIALKVLMQNLSSNGESQEHHGSRITSASKTKRSRSPSPSLRSIPVMFSFTMESLIVELFHQPPRLQNSVQLPMHGPEHSLARFTLNTLAVKGVLCSDGTVSTTLLLVDCLLDDSRHGRKVKLTRLLERKPDDPGTVVQKHMPRNVEITYKKKGEHVDVDIRIFSFNLILNVEYLTKLGLFFASALQTAETVPARLKAHASSSMLSLHAKAAETTTTTIILHAEKPDIFLVEDMEDIDTSALVLRSEISCALRIGSIMEIKGSITDLQLYSCCYNPERRKDTLSQILQPCGVEVNGTTRQLDVHTTDVRLRVSPGTIELLTKVARAVYGREVGQDGHKHSDPDLSDLWQHKSFQDSDHWFLKKSFSELNMSAEGSVGMSASPETTTREICVVVCPSIAVTVEAGLGSHTLPMILLNASVQGSVHNWNSQLFVDSSLSIQMAYYNSCLALWEPLIEPVESINEGQTMQCPWKLTVKTQVCKPQAKPVNLLGGDFEVVPHESSSTNISIFSKDNLEVTLTKTCMDVLINLSKAFHMAMDEGLMAHAGPVAPFMVCNHLGLPVTLLLQAGLFKVHGSTGQQVYQLESGSSIGLSMDYSSTPSPVSLMTRSRLNERFLKILVNQLEVVLDLPVVQANQRFFPLHGSYGLVSAVRVEDGCTIVTIRSVIQVFNHLGVPVDIQCRIKQGSQLEYVGTVAPADYLDLPLHAVYTPTNELFIRVPGYSAIPYVWTDSTSLSDARLYECKPERSTPSKEPYFLRITSQLEQVYYTTMQMLSGTSYRVHVRPAVIIKNLLPIGLVCHQRRGTSLTKTLEAGEHIQLASARPGVSNILFHIPEYCQQKWDCLYKVDPNCQEFAVVQFTSDRSLSMELGMHTIKRNGSIVMSLYCPFWMLNKTGIHLSYWQALKTSEILHHPATSRSPVLFPSFSNKNKVAIRVENGSGVWSDQFSLDVAGSSGVVTCRVGNMFYKIGVHIHLMRATLIKQVTFTPYYVLINNSHHSIECQEADRPADPWTKVEAGGCCPFWPKLPNEAVSLRAKVCGLWESTAPFSCGTVHTTLLQLHNKYGGLNVDVQLTEGAVYITFTSYEEGQAPAIIMNHTGMLIPFSEKGSDTLQILNPREQMVFAWSNPSGPRELDWAPNIDADVCKLCKDGSGSFYLEREILIYWSSFLDGLQRVLLFSWDHTMAEGQKDTRRVLQKVTIAIQGLGLSLVNDHTCSELMYIGISKKPANLKEKRSKTLQSSSTEKISWHNEVGLWIQVKLLPHELQLHAKVNHLQADNQLMNCIYPVALAPVPPPRSVVANVVKPFAELSVVRRSTRHSSVQQFKYVMLLIQEFHIKLDIGFVSTLLAMLEAGQVSDDIEAAHFLEDRRLVSAPLLAHAVLHSAQGQKNFFDLLHFSPFKIHLSFSLGSGRHSSGQETPHVLRVLLRSLGVTLTDVQDVVFKLAYFERRNTFLTYRQVASEAVLHYRGQALKQLYVLVLGLDVLGNPYGLVLGLKQGVEDLFYEPFQGAIQGPEEFAEGLVLGMRSLLGHTVGGAAGAMSRITGAMGKGVAALTFDEDYQRKRQETLSQRPANVQTGLAQSSKGLVMGMVDGVSGVFLKPISGAKKEGVEGFFKGMGKGVVGLVARPTSGIIDFASGSLDAVKRTADTTVEVPRQRPPRFFHRDGLLRPYVRKEAEGNKLLQELDERQFAASDVYEFHLSIEPNCKDVLLVTNKRVMVLIYVEIFDRWKLDWEHAWDTLVGPPMILAEGIYFRTGKSSRKVMGLLGSNSAGRIILIKDTEQKKWVVEKIKVLMKN